MGAGGVCGRVFPGIRQSSEAVSEKGGYRRAGLFGRQQRPPCRRPGGYPELSADSPPRPAARPAEKVWGGRCRRGSGGPKPAEKELRGQLGRRWDFPDELCPHHYFRHAPGDAGEADGWVRHVGQPAAGRDHVPL